MDGGAPTRRAFCALLPAAAALSVAGCGGPTKAEQGWSAELPVGRIPPNGRVVLHLSGKVVELTRQGRRVTARSMKCTHFGCEVQWNEGERLYRCPCHEGRFDADGRPVAGPPTAPLEVFAATLAGTTVFLTGAR